MSKWVKRSFAHFWANEWLAQKTDERIPSPGLKQTLSFFFNRLFQTDLGKTARVSRILSPNPTLRPLPCRLIQSFFYGYKEKIILVCTVQCATENFLTHRNLEIMYIVHRVYTLYICTVQRIWSANRHKNEDNRISFTFGKAVPNLVDPLLLEILELLLFKDLGIVQRLPLLLRLICQGCRKLAVAHKLQ